MSLVRAGIGATVRWTEQTPGHKPCHITARIDAIRTTTLKLFVTSVESDDAADRLIIGTVITRYFSRVMNKTTRVVSTPAAYVLTDERKKKLRSSIIAAFAAAACRKPSCKGAFNHVSIHQQKHLIRQPWSRPRID